MNDFEFKGYKISEISFVNKIQGNRKIELNNKYSYNVGYSKINTCRGEFRAEIFDKTSPELFSVTVVMEGYFSINGEVAKELLHVKTYEALFPYVKAAVSTITANAGIPPVMMPYVDISKQNIYRVEMPPRENSDDE